MIYVLSIITAVHKHWTAFGLTSMYAFVTFQLVNETVTTVWCKRNRNSNVQKSAAIFSEREVTHFLLCQLLFVTQKIFPFYAMREDSLLET